MFWFHQLSWKWLKKGSSPRSHIALISASSVSFSLTQSFNLSLSVKTLKLLSITDKLFSRTPLLGDYPTFLHEHSGCMIQCLQEVVSGSTWWQSVTGEVMLVTLGPKPNSAIFFSFPFLKPSSCLASHLWFFPLPTPSSCPPATQSLPSKQLFYY